MFKIKENSFFIDNREEYLISAEIHYFRVSSENWRNIIEKAIELGCNAIAFYIPWFVHENKEGEFDFEGIENQNYNLIGFLELLKEFDLKIILRPGPYIYAEMTNLGLPNWLTENYKEHSIKNFKDGKLVKDEFSFAFAHNNPVFREKTKKYLKKVIEVTKAYDKNIIMIQLCNEIPGLDIDDHSEYRNDYLKRFLTSKFTISQFNEIFQSDYSNFNEVEIEKIYEHNNYKNLHLEEQYSSYFFEYFKFLEDIYVSEGMDKVFLHNAYNPKAISLFPKIKELMPNLLVGVDNYYSLFGSLNDKTISYFCEYGVSYLKNILKNVPFVVEQESGFWHDTPKVFGQELYIFNFWSLLYGYKGLNMYLFHSGVNEKGMGFNGVDHNWQALVDLKGEKTERYEYVKKAISEARENLSVSVDVKYDCAMAFEHFPGLIWDTLSRHTEEFYHFLFKANHQVEIIDILKLPVEELKKYKVIYFLVDERLSEELQLKLIELIKSNFPIVLVGNLPTSTWYKKCDVLINYLNLGLIKQKRDGFSQKLLLGNNEILYPVKNLDIIQSDFLVEGKTNYDIPVILKKNNLIIINGFPVFQMKDQLKIIEYIDKSFNIVHSNYGTELRVVKKVDGSVFVLNPSPFIISEELLINSKKIQVEVDGFSYKFIESNVLK